MDDSAPGRRPRAGQRGDRRRTAGPSVLTPPTGLPTVDDVPADIAVPAQRSAPVDPPKPPLQPVVVDPCACGHGKDAHRHYRPGTDCGVCGAAQCAVFRPTERVGVLKRLFRGG